LQTTVGSASAYLRGILKREQVDSSASSELRWFEPRVHRICDAWAGKHLLEVVPSGAFEKGTANASGLRIDFLASLAPTARFSPREVFESLYHSLDKMGLEPEARNVSVSVNLDGTPIDIIPARRDAMETDEHWLYSALKGKSIVTNPTQHVVECIAQNRAEEIRVLKLWRDKYRLSFPSYYLELTVLAALKGRPGGQLSDNVWAVLGYLERHFVARSVLDPTNANNVVSDELTPAEKIRIRTMAQISRNGRSWQEILS
jgi:hypothetical protein